MDYKVDKKLYNGYDLSGDLLDSMMEFHVILIQLGFCFENCAFPLESEIIENFRLFVEKNPEFCLNEDFIEQNYLKKCFDSLENDEKNNDHVFKFLETVFRYPNGIELLFDSEIMLNFNNILENSNNPSKLSNVLSFFRKMISFNENTLVYVFSKLNLYETFLNWIRYPECELEFLELVKLSVREETPENHFGFLLFYIEYSYQKKHFEFEKELLSIVNSILCLSRIQNATSFVSGSIIGLISHSLKYPSGSFPFGCNCVITLCEKYQLVYDEHIEIIKNSDEVYENDDFFEEIMNVADSMMKLDKEFYPIFLGEALLLYSLHYLDDSSYRVKEKIINVYSSILFNGNIKDITEPGRELLKRIKELER